MRAALTRPASLLVAFAALALTGCYAVEMALDDHLVVYGPTTPVAVGEPVVLAVGDACAFRRGRGWEGKIPSPSPDSPCSTEMVVELTHVAVRPEGIFDLRREGLDIVVTPRREGTVQIEVRALMDDGSIREGVKTMTSAWPDRVLVDARCVNVSQPGPSRFVSEHSRLDFTARVLEPYVQYAGGEVPWSADALLPPDETGRWGTPAADVPVTITSPIDPGLSEPLALFGPADVEGFEIAFTDGPDGGSLTIAHPTRVAGERPCVDLLPRAVRFLSPDVCDLGPERGVETVVANNRMGLTVHRAGECVVEIALDGGPSAVVRRMVAGPSAP